MTSIEPATANRQRSPRTWRVAASHRRRRGQAPRAVEAPRARRTTPDAAPRAGSRAPTPARTPRRSRRALPRSRARRPRRGPRATDRPARGACPRFRPAPAPSRRPRRTRASPGRPPRRAPRPARAPGASDDASERLDVAVRERAPERRRPQDVASRRPAAAPLERPRLRLRPPAPPRRRNTATGTSATTTRVGARRLRGPRRARPHDRLLAQRVARDGPPDRARLRLAPPHRPHVDQPLADDEERVRRLAHREDARPLRRARARAPPPRAPPAPTSSMPAQPRGPPDGVRPARHGTLRSARASSTGSSRRQHPLVDLRAARARCPRGPARARRPRTRAPGTAGTARKSRRARTAKGGGWPWVSSDVRVRDGHAGRRRPRVDDGVGRLERRRGPRRARPPGSTSRRAPARPRGSSGTRRCPDRSPRRRSGRPACAPAPARRCSGRPRRRCPMHRTQRWKPFWRLTSPAPAKRVPPSRGSGDHAGTSGPSTTSAPKSPCGRPRASKTRRSRSRGRSACRRGPRRVGRAGRPRRRAAARVGHRAAPPRSRAPG